MSIDYKIKIIEIQKKLKKKLSDTRYQHSLGVAYTAASLAMKYSEDVNKALIAGLLHDCGKYMSSEEMYSFAIKKFIDISNAESKKPDLLHAKIGSYLALKKYGITDPDINSAIRYHTTGKPDMNLLEKIIYIADYIEPGRDKMPRLDIIRKTAFEDIDECLKMILEDSVNYLKNSNMTIDETTYNTYEFYINKDNCSNIENNTDDIIYSNDIVEIKEKVNNGRKNKRRRISLSSRNRKGIR